MLLTVAVNLVIISPFLLFLGEWGLFGDSPSICGICSNCVDLNTGWSGGKIEMEKDAQDTSLRVMKATKNSYMMTAIFYHLCMYVSTHLSIHPPIIHHLYIYHLSIYHWCIYLVWYSIKEIQSQDTLRFCFHRFYTSILFYKTTLFNNIVTHFLLKFYI